MATKEKDTNKELEVEEIVSKSEQFIENNSKKIIYGIIAIALVVGAVLGIKHGYLIPQEKKAAAAMFKGEQYFARDSFNLALNGNGADYEGFEAIIDQYGSTSAANLAKAYAGICYFKMGNNEKALDMLKSFRIKTYDEDTGYGLLRHVLVRRGFFTDEIMVVIVIGSPIFPSKNNFVKALRKKYPQITTVVLNVNDKKTSMVLGERDIVIYGKGYIRDTLCGCTFRISPQSFYQVNPVQTEILYKTAIEYAGLGRKETVIDAYCGIGTIGLVAAKRAKNVIGVELNPDAVRDARINAKENKITNPRFYQGDAGEFMENMAENGEHADVVFMDPPRTGSDKKFMSSVIKLNPSRIVYISCGPETLARDLEYLTKHGYDVRKIQPVDMFSFTDHCENICLLTKKFEK